MVKTLYSTNTQQKNPILQLFWPEACHKAEEWPESMGMIFSSVQFSSVHSLSCVWLSATPWTAAHQALRPTPILVFYCGAVEEKAQGLAVASDSGGSPEF